MDLLDNIIVKMTKIPQKPIKTVVFWSGMLFGLFLLAQITWKMVPDATQAAVPWQPTPVSANSVDSANIDVNKIEKLALFGQYVAKPDEAKQPAVQQFTDAPKTALSIQLTGVVASTEKKKGVAVIASSGGQETYSLGDKIKGTSASLKEVYADRVIIVNRGRYETLMLDGMKYETQGKARPRPNKPKSQVKKVVDQRDNKKIARELKASRDELLADPGKITDYISISPVKEGGEIQGYRLNAGKDRALFKEAGLKPNDLAKSINGYDLTDTSQAFEVMSSLPELTEISLMVERDGQLVEIMFGLPQ